MNLASLLLSGTDPTSRAIQAYLAECAAASYYSPYFVLIQTEADSAWAEPLIEKCGEPWGLAPISCIVISRNALFLAFECSVAEVKHFVDDFMAAVDADRVVTHMAVFHHNCLGEPRDTFEWTAMLLEQVVGDSPRKSAVSCNDFSDRKNWPGLSMYMKDEPGETDSATV